MTKLPLRLIANLLPSFQKRKKGGGGKGRGATVHDLCRFCGSFLFLFRGGGRKKKRKKGRVLKVYLTKKRKEKRKKKKRGRGRKDMREIWQFRIPFSLILSEEEKNKKKKRKEGRRMAVARHRIFVLPYPIEGKKDTYPFFTRKEERKKKEGRKKNPDTSPCFS